MSDASCVRRESLLACREFAGIDALLVRKRIAKRGKIDGSLFYGFRGKFLYGFRCRRFYGFRSTFLTVPVLLQHHVYPLESNISGHGNMSSFQFQCVRVYVKLRNRFLSAFWAQAPRTNRSLRASGPQLASRSPAGVRAWRTLAAATLGRVLGRCGGELLEAAGLRTRAGRWSCTSIGADSLGTMCCSAPVLVYIYIYIYIYIYTHTYVINHTVIIIYVCVHIYIYVYIGIHIYICTSVYIYTYT